MHQRIQLTEWKGKLWNSRKYLNPYLIGGTKNTYNTAIKKKKKNTVKKWAENLIAIPVVQLVKNQPAMREAWVHSLGWEDCLEKGTPTRSSILAWTIPWTEEPGRPQSTGSQRVGHDWVTFTFKDTQVISKHMKRCSTSLIIREMQIKITVRYHLTLTRMATIKELDNNKCW